MKKRRDTTPRTQVFLNLHKNAYQVALVDEVPDESCCKVVRSMDEVYCSAPFYFKTRDPAEQKFFQAYLQLRKLELLANSGDYVGQELQQIRAHLKLVSIEADDQRQATAAGLGVLETRESTTNSRTDQGMLILRQHGFVADDLLGIDLEHILWLIQEWATRNTIFHNQIRNYISGCSWSDLARQIF